MLLYLLKIGSLIKCSCLPQHFPLPGVQLFGELKTLKEILLSCLSLSLFSNITNFVPSYCCFYFECIVCRCPGKSEEGMDPLEPELQVVVSHLLWLLETLSH